MTRLPAPITLPAPMVTPGSTVTPGADPYITPTVMVGVFQPLIALLNIQRVAGGGKGAVWCEEYIVAKDYLGVIQNNTVVVCVEIFADFDIVTVITPKSRLDQKMGAGFSEDLTESFLPFFQVGRRNLVAGITKVFAGG